MLIITLRSVIVISYVATERCISLSIGKTQCPFYSLLVKYLGCYWKTRAVVIMEIFKGFL
jgi:hypothetical protein